LKHQSELIRQQVSFRKHKIYSYSLLLVYAVVHATKKFNWMTDPFASISKDIKLTTGLQLSDLFMKHTFRNAKVQGHQDLLTPIASTKKCVMDMPVCAV
jgi:hypothetical protein